jgi:Holliday junction resolvase RusA-like endonuclease
MKVELREYKLPVVPIPAPRMTRQDRFAKRPVVERYKAFRTELLMRSRLQGLTDLPASVGFIFYIPMPVSWSQRKRAEMEGTMHQQTPDLDNLIKAVLDCFTYGRHVSDSYVGTFLFAQKVWATEGSITIYEVPREEGRACRAVKTVVEWVNALINHKPKQ